MSEEILSGALYVVSTPIGNLEDITLRAARVLAGVDVVAAEDTRVTGFLLRHLAIRKPMVSYYAPVEERRAAQLLRLLKQGKSVALVTDAGTPGVSDPAFAVIRSAVLEGIPVVAVPGASALLAGLVVSGLPMDRFVFEGFLPVKKGRRSKLEALKTEERTIVLYESPFRIQRTVRDILDVFGDRPLAVAREVTKKFEEVYRGSASTVLAQLESRPPRGEYVVIVGAAGGKHP